MTDPDGEGSITMDITEARRLFPTAEIAPDGESGNGQAFDAWLDEGADVALYRALDGRLLARQARRAHPPSTKLFSDRYDSAQLIGVFLSLNTACSPRLSTTVAASVSASPPAKTQ
ncbi:hypothetical protein ACFHYQ_16095 [Sphaerimonospora cavernae]|uniref:Uncharacterized protein n=1 Tax=Sphaerimonospora cavernae TaxID=1740611 RepID=A0ABV6U8T9_9ACTN